MAEDKDEKLKTAFHRLNEFISALAELDDESAHKLNDWMSLCFEQYKTKVHLMEQDAKNSLAPNCLASKNHTEDENKKFYAVMAVFGDYIEGHPDFELFYSEKNDMYFGAYVQDLAMGDMEPYLFQTADEMFEYLIRQFINDVLNLNLNGERLDDELMENELAELKGVFHF